MNLHIKKWCTLQSTDKVLDAVEVAEKQAMSATSAATTRMVSNR